MTDTRHLIERLVSQGAPIRPIRPPIQRMLTWLAVAMVMVALPLSVIGVRPDLQQALRDPWALGEWLLSLTVALMAGYAVFEISVPGRSVRWAWLSLPPFLAWLGLLSWGCLSALGGSPDATALGSPTCAAAIALTAIPIAIVTLLMVRFARATRPVLAALLGALAATSLSSAATWLHHGGDTGVALLVWHGGAVVGLTAACALMGRPMFAWLGIPRR